MGLFRAIVGTWVFLVGLCLPLAGHAQVAATNLTLWVDASSITGLNDGDPVAVWSNKSTFVPHDLTQTATNSQPIYKTAVVNGLPAVRFDGLNDLFESASMSNFITYTEYTMFTVFNTRFVSTDNNSSWLNDPLIMDHQGYVGQLLKGSTAIAYNFAVSDDHIGTPITSNEWFMLETRHEDTNLFVRANIQPEQSTNTGWTAASQTGINSLNLRVGGTAAYGQYFDGDIAEILIYNRALNPSERQFVEGYLGDKYGIAVPEPSSIALMLFAAAATRFRRRS